MFEHSTSKCHGECEFLTTSSCVFHVFALARLGPLLLSLFNGSSFKHSPFEFIYSILHPCGLVCLCQNCSPCCVTSHTLQQSRVSSLALSCCSSIPSHSNSSSLLMTLLGMRLAFA